MAKLLSSLPVGAKVKDTLTTYNGKPIIFMVMEHSHTGDPQNSTALITEKIITLKAFDAKEKSGDSNRVNYGNNRYLYSNIRQWLNSQKNAPWYTAQHSADDVPSNRNVYNGYNEYDQENGFLTNFSTQMKNSLLQATKNVVKNSAADGGGYENVIEKIFLLSNTEVGLANENGVAEGTLYALFKTSSNRVVYPTAEAVSNSEYSSSSLSKDNPWYWWLRTPYVSNSYITRGVYTDGSLSHNDAYCGHFGVRPACIVPSSILVTDSTDSDGAYTIIWNAPPTITVDGENLGDKNSPFSVGYSITDKDNDVISVTISVDDSVEQTIAQVEQGKSLTYKITAVMLNSMENGEHTITISARDGYGNTTIKMISFNKTQSPVTISGEDENIGKVWINPSYVYCVSNTDKNVAVNVVEEIDGEVTSTKTAVELDADINVDFSAFDALENEREHTLTITATDSSGMIAIRTITFVKLGDRIQFYTDAIETDEAAQKIVVITSYGEENDPEIKIEVTNNAMAVMPTWEDATEAYKTGTFYRFYNRPTGGFGVSVRITLRKNARTERVYVNSVGFSFC